MKVVALCFLAASTFWFLNALNKDNYNTVVDYPIEIIFDKEEFMAVEKLPSKVKIEINGNGWDLLRKYFNVNESPFVIEINNPANKNHILASEIRRSLAENISPTTLVSMVTDSIKFNIDKIVTRKVKVEADTTGNVIAKNHRIQGEIEIQPATVTVKGPTSILDKLEGSLHIKLGEDKINKSIDKFIPITIPSEWEEFLSMEEESVQVKFNIVQLLEGNKRLKINKINFPENVTLVQEPNNVMMYYLIEEPKIEQLKQMEFEAILNYSNRDKEDSTISITLSPRTSILENIRFEPSIFRLKYE
ncbi:YbbR-like domain-containing protein [Belliella kenyensis]|uniref:YbbR-like domain-containing protein n=1 Tax=Belliella kenyensis TaxID=1472724 RepID=A0ABV8EJV5_9BACT|nr:YbbR-like domain-containing protein [Belliella kenyensis]MCH7402360.1 YbbR-like domain-containing protein [Belliella kenyensis]MDN3603552.1 YbbR-like domain-containing protein [Belliella kenyensis]